MGLLKGVFFTGLIFVSNLTGVNSLNAVPLSAAPLNVIPLKYISMNNQECRVKPQIINVNSKEPVLFPFSIKTSKCCGSCNNVSNPYAKLGVLNVVKNLNVKVFNLMSRTNETRHKMPRNM